MVRASLVATVLSAPSPHGAELAALGDNVEWLEIRADLIGDQDVDWLRSHFRGRLIYTLRSCAEGGSGAESLSERRNRLASAAKQYDLVNLEADRDLSSEVLSAIPARQRLISWHGSAITLAQLKSRFAQLSETTAAFYKLVPPAEKAGDELPPLSLVKLLRRTDVIAYGAGPIGFWSRVVGLSLGSPLVFGAVGSGPEIGEEPSITRLIEDYGLPAVVPIEAIYGIAANPVSHSLSPRLHNAAYRALGRRAIYVPFHVESFIEFWEKVVEGCELKSMGIPIMGLTVASPYKEIALSTAAVTSRFARGAGSANVLVRHDGHWTGGTTDPDIVFMANRELGVQLKHKRAAVVGCGGAGRAIAAALDQSGADVTLVNRGEYRGYYAAQLLGLPYTPLREFDPGGYDIVVNATPVGRDDDQVPFALERLDSEVVVIDLVYSSKPTPLVARMRALEHLVIDGRDVLVTQVLHQFKLMTGKEMPAMLARETLSQRVGISEANWKFVGTKQQPTNH